MEVIDDPVLERLQRIQKDAGASSAQTTTRPGAGNRQRAAGPDDPVGRPLRRIQATAQPDKALLSGAPDEPVLERLRRIQTPTRPEHAPAAPEPEAAPSEAAPSEAAPEPEGVPGEPPRERPSLGERAETLLGAIPRGAATAVSLMLEGLSSFSPAPATRGGQSPERMRQILANARRMREQRIEATIDRETVPSRLGTALDAYAGARFPEAPELQDAFVNRILEGLGTTVPYLVAGAASGGASLPVMATMGVASAEGELIRQARQADATAEETAQGQLIAALGGASEALPLGRALARLVPRGVRRRAADVAIGGLEEAAQEGTQQITQNVAARQGIDPDRAATAHAGEAAAYGGAVGTLLNALIALVPGRMRAGGPGSPGGGSPGGGSPGGGSPAAPAGAALEPGERLPAPAASQALQRDVIRLRELEDALEDAPPGSPAEDRIGEEYFAILMRLEQAGAAMPQGDGARTEASTEAPRAAPQALPPATTSLESSGAQIPSQPDQQADDASTDIQAGDRAGERPPPGDERLDVRGDVPELTDLGRVPEGAGRDIRIERIEAQLRTATERVAEARRALDAQARSLQESRETPGENLFGEQTGPQREATLAGMERPQATAEDSGRILAPHRERLSRAQQDLNRLRAEAEGARQQLGAQQEADFTEGVPEGEAGQDTQAPAPAPTSDVEASAFTTADKQYQVERAEDGTLTVTNTRTGQAVDRRSSRHDDALAEYLVESADAIEARGGRVTGEEVRGAGVGQYPAVVARSSANPIEIAEAYVIARQQAQSAPASDDPVLRLLVENAPYTSTSQAIRASASGDEIIQRGLGNWTRRGSEDVSLDVVADLASRETGREVSVDELIEIMEASPGGPTRVRTDVQRQAEALQASFRDVTGKTLTTALADAIVEARYGTQATQAETDARAPYESGAEGAAAAPFRRRGAAPQADQVPQRGDRPVEEEGVDGRGRPGPEALRRTAEQVEAAVSGFEEAGLPARRLYSSPEELPADLRRDYEAGQREGTVTPGMYAGGRGVLIASEIARAAEASGLTIQQQAQATYLHEIGVHEGLRTLFESEARATEALAELAQVIGTERMRAVDLDGRTLFDFYAPEGILAVEQATPAQRAQLAEEYLAHLGEPGLNLDPSFVRRVLDFLRRSLGRVTRALGRPPTDAELKLIIEAGARNLAARRNGTTPPAVTRFLYVGVQAQGFEEATAEGRTFTGRYDQKERFEIEDSGARLIGGGYLSREAAETPGAPVVRRGTLEGVLDHEALFRAYPALRQVPTRVFVSAGYDQPSGAYNHSKQAIEVHAPTDSAALSTLLHEVEHAIQDTEGFARGGSPADVVDQGRTGALLDRLMSGELTQEEFTEARRRLNRLAYEDYRRLAGEVEARDVQARRGFSEAERALVEPYSSENVPAGEAIVRFQRRSERESSSGEQTFSPEEGAQNRINEPARVVGVDPYAIEAEGLDAYQRLAEQYGKRHMTGLHLNEDTGWSLKVTGGQSISKLARQRSRTGDFAFLKRALVTKLDELIERAVLVHTHPDNKGVRQVRRMHRFFVPIRNTETGEVLPVKITAKEYKKEFRERDPNLPRHQQHAVEIVNISKWPAGGGAFAPNMGLGRGQAGGAPVAVDPQAAGHLQYSLRDFTGQVSFDAEGKARDADDDIRFQRRSAPERSAPEQAHGPDGGGPNPANFDSPQDFLRAYAQHRARTEGAEAGESQNVTTRDLPEAARRDLPRQMEPAEEAAVERPRRPISRPEVIESFVRVVKAAGLSVGVRVGRGVKRGAKGTFNLRTRMVDLRSADDLPTAAHEVAHALELALFSGDLTNQGDLIGRPESLSDEALAELHALGKELYGDQSPAGGYVSEGFAEYVSYWLLDPEAAAREAPTFTVWFEETALAQQADVRAALDRGRAAAAQWQEQGAEARARASIEGMEAPSLLRRTRALLRPERLRRMKDWLARKVLTQLQPLKTAADQANAVRSEPLPVHENPFTAAEALQKTHTARVRHMVRYHMIDLWGNKAGPSLRQALSAVREGREEFTLYLWARRARRLWEGQEEIRDPDTGEIIQPAKEPRNPGLALEDAIYIIEQYDSDAFRRAAEDVYAWQDGLLEYARPAFGNETIDRIRAGDVGDYVPLQRVFDQLYGRYYQMKRGGGAIQGGDPARRLKGSGRRIRDPFRSMIENAETWVRSAHERYVLNQLVALADEEGMGQYIREVPKRAVPVTVSTDQLTEALTDLGFSISEEGDGPTAEIATLFTGAYTPPGSEPIVAVHTEEGIKWYEVNEELYASLAGLDFKRLPVVLDWLFGKPARLFRLGVTGLRASFSLITNPARDLPTLYAQSRSSQRPLAMFAAWLRGMRAGLGYSLGERIDKNPYFAAFYRLGGSMARPLGHDTNETRRAVREAFGDRKVLTLDPRKWQDAGAATIDYLRDVLQFPESATRVVELEARAREIGWKPGTPMTPEQSVQPLLDAKRVTTDFTSQGAFTGWLNTSIPFTTATIGGQRAFVRSFKTNAKRAVLAGLSLTVLSLASWWRNKDEEWYKDLPYSEKFRYWHIQINDALVVRIPRPFEWGAIFASMPEAFIDAAYNDDPEQIKALFGRMFADFNPLSLGLTEAGVPVLEDAPVPVTWLQEQLANEKFFFDSPIEPFRARFKPAEERFGPYTSTVAVELGDIFGISPRRIDHTIRTFTGGVGADATQALSRLLETLGVERSVSVVEREKTAADLPVVGTLFRRGGTAGRSRAVDEFYEALERAQIRSRSERRPETGAEREVRLMMTDAQRALSVLYIVRSNTPEADKRRQVMRLIRRTARTATRAAGSGNIEEVRRLRGEVYPLRTLDIDLSRLPADREEVRSALLERSREEAAQLGGEVSYE